MTISFKRYRRLLLVLAFVVAALVCAGFWLYSSRYPYGYSHSCIKAFIFALEQYADDHDGRYPAEQDSPEASLSMLHRPPYDLNAEALRGKTVPVEVIGPILDRGGLLGPDTCGWHYVEGLTQNDDRRLALLWDKVGLGHFGERYRSGSREVLFVGGDIRSLSAAEWPAFLEEQQRLLASRDEAAIRGGPILVATIRWPTGEITDHHDGPYRIEEHHVFSGGESKGDARQGGVLRPSNLKWKRKDLVPADGVKTWVLWLFDKKMRSRPVVVRLENGRPTPYAVVFEMEEVK
jgi:hypothetical protein